MQIHMLLYVCACLSHICARNTNMHNARLLAIYVWMRAHTFLSAEWAQPSGINGIPSTYIYIYIYIYTYNLYNIPKGPESSAPVGAEGPGSGPSAPIFRSFLHTRSTLRL